MPVKRGPGRPCTICGDPKRLSFVNENLALGKTAHAIEMLSREPFAEEIGIGVIKDSTVLRHLRHKKPFVVSAEERLVVEDSQAVPQPVYERVPSPPVAPSVNMDVASLVAEKAAEGLRDGTLRVSTAHGLQAQRMLDAREDKRQDRQLAIALARMLSGNAVVPGHLIVKNITPLSSIPEDDFAPSLASGDE